MALAAEQQNEEREHPPLDRTLPHGPFPDCDYTFGVRAPSLIAGTVSLPHSGMLSPLGVNTSTEKVKVRPSPGCSAPTPTICRPTSSPRSFLMLIITEYSHASPTFGWRIEPSTRRG